MNINLFLEHVLMLIQFCCRFISRNDSLPYLIKFDLYNEKNFPWNFQHFNVNKQNIYDTFSIKFTPEVKTKAFLQWESMLR